MNHLATFLLIAALVVLAAIGVTEHRAESAPVVNAAWTQQAHLFPIIPHYSPLFPVPVSTQSVRDHEL